MRDGHSYLASTAPATEGLFKLLNQYGWQKMRALADLLNVKTRDEFDQHHAAFTCVDVAREVVAGSILQIAYVGIKKFAVAQAKSVETLNFEDGMNKIIAELPNPRIVQLLLPDGFCVGKLIGNLPFGMVVYAARNQYNHFDEGRLSVLNEIVFNHLNTLWPRPGNGLSFDLSDGTVYRSYSALWALGWTDTSKGLGYSAYKEDMSSALHVEF